MLNRDSVVRKINKHGRFNIFQLRDNSFEVKCQEGEVRGIHSKDQLVEFIRREFPNSQIIFSTTHTHTCFTSSRIVKFSMNPIPSNFKVFNEDEFEVRFKICD